MGIHSLSPLAASSGWSIASIVCVVDDNTLLSVCSTQYDSRFTAAPREIDPNYKNFVFLFGCKSLQCRANLSELCRKIDADD